MKQPVTENNPLVSVYMTTYNHEKYIAQALDSVLSQNCTFSFEICISDDASSDHTCDIICSYQEKYPNIRLKQHEVNQGLTANFYYVKCMCNGKYIVDLSGDDYWIDDHKLEKQVSFLEEHPDYLAVGTVIAIRPDDSEATTKYVPDSKYWNRDFTLEMFLSGENCPLNGMMMRNVYLDPEQRKFFGLMPKMSKYIDDITDELLIHMRGKVYILGDATVAYRVRVETKDDKNFGSLNRGMLFLEKHMELMNHLVLQFGEDVDLFGRYREVLANGFLTAAKAKQLGRFNELCKEIPDAYQKRHLKWESLKLVPGKVASKLFKSA